VCVAKGIATATEAAAIAVVYSLVLTALVYRTLTVEKLRRALSHAARTTGVVLLLIAVSNMLRFQMSYLEIPDAIEGLLKQSTAAPWLMLLYINVIQVFLGTFVDMAAHPDHDSAVPADRDGLRRRARAVRHHAAAELLARPRASADRLGAVRRLRDRQRVDRRDDQDGVAVLPRDLQRDQHRHVHAVLLHLAAEPDQRARGVLSTGIGPRRRTIEVVRRRDRVNGFFLRGWFAACACLALCMQVTDAGPRCSMRRARRTAGADTRLVRVPGPMRAA
jgi:hypothetical protein